MNDSLKIRVSDAPVADHVRTQMERDDWYEPAVRYLRRKKNGDPPTPRLCPQSEFEDHLLVEFAGLEVRLEAHEDQVVIILTDVSGLASGLSRAA